MLLYIDVESQKLVEVAGTRIPLSSVAFKRGDSARVEIQFVSGTTVQELSGTTITGSFGLKEDGKYDTATCVVGPASWTKEGSGTSTKYVFEPNFNTTALNTLLAHGDADDTNDVASVTLMGEISWTIDGAVYSTQEFDAIVANDVLKGGEASPIALEDEAQAWLADNGIVYDPDITGLTGGTATDLDSIATVGLDVGRLQAVVTTAEGLLIYELQASTVSEVSPIRIRPDDYAASTNEKVWVLRTPPVYLFETAGDLSIQFSGTQLVLTDPAGPNPSCSMRTSGSLVFDDGGFSMSVDFPTPSADRTWDLPDRDGIFSFDPTLVPATPTTGFTITVTTEADQTHYLTPAGTLATGTFQLPTAANSRAGQIVRLHSTEEVTASTVEVAGSGTLSGASISTIAADTTYAFQCVSTSGNGTWIRLH